MKFNKKAMELQVNFLVIIIITLIIFAFSIAIAVKVLNKTSNLKYQIDTTTERQLESLIISGNEEVIIPFNKKEGIEQGQSVVFGLAVLNNLGGPADFKASITSANLIDKSGNSLGSAVLNNGAPDYNFIFTPTLTVGRIKKNEYKIVSIVFITGENKDGKLNGATAIYTIKVESNTGSGWKDYPLRDPERKIRIMFK